MKKLLGFLLVFTMGLVVSATVMAEEVTIVGTGSGMAILKTVGDAFSLENPGVTVVVPKSIGSGGGIKAVGNDKNAMGRVARKIKDKEKHYGLSYVAIAKMPIVFYINKNVGIENLNPQQVCDIYSGKVTNWQDVGGANAKIRVIRREDGDSSLSVLLKTLPGFKDINLTSRSKTTYNDQETCKLTEDTKNAIAFGTYGNARNYNVDILNINGKVPTGADYPYVGTLALIFKEKNNTGNIKKFVEFASSQNAHDAIREAGGLPY